MDILLLITKGEIGGAQQSVFTLAKEFTSRGLNITVGFDGGIFLKDKLTTNKISQIHFRHLKRTKNIFQALFFCFEFYQHLKNNHYDVVHGNSTNTLFALCITKIYNPNIKTIFTFRGLSVLDTQYKNKIIQYLYTFLFKILLRACDTQVYVSQDNLNTATRLGIVRNAHVIYNALPPDTTFLSRLDAKIQLQHYIPVKIDHVHLIGSIGRIAYQKNYPYVVDIVAHCIPTHSDIHTIIIGDGPGKARLTHYIQEKKLEKYITLVDGIPNASRLLLGFDTFILPSLYEGMSITLLEVLKAGVPILASDIPTNKETIQDGGVLFPLFNSSTASQLAQQVFYDQTLRTQMISNAQKRSQTFDVDITAQSYLTVYQSL